jgi:hypothetical protein
MALFDHPRAFEEIYCTSLRVLGIFIFYFLIKNKKDNTWDEMMASYMDFPRVIAGKLLSYFYFLLSYSLVNKN